MRILLIRYGAWGDSIIITPLLRYLKKMGCEIYLHTSERGGEVLAGNPNVDKFIPYVSNSIPDEKLEAYWENLRKEHNCEVILNMCESIERVLSFVPADPVYAYTKQERKERGDKNFYEYAFEHAYQRVPSIFSEDPLNGSMIPELFFTEEEETKMRNWFGQFGKDFVILWGLSGSGLNKSYPYTDLIIADLLRANKNLKIITTGDELCQMLEGIEDKRVIRKSGKWTMRESSLACKYADMVVAPDTGLIHAAGCFETPKLCLVGSNTINNITKHFINDFSIQADEAKAPCSPCFRIIQSASIQCPTDPLHYLPICMSLGIDPKKVLERIKNVITNFAGSKVSRLQTNSAR